MKSSPELALAATATLAIVAAWAVLARSPEEAVQAPALEFGASRSGETPASSRAVARDEVERRREALLGEGPSAPELEESRGEAFGSSVRVALVDPLGVPIEIRGASVNACDEQGRDSRSTRIQPALFEWSDLAPGRWWIAGRAPGFEESVREVLIPPTRTHFEITLALAKAPSVRIALLTPEGEPFARFCEPDHLHVFATRRRPERWLSEVLDLEVGGECSWLRGSAFAGLEERYLGLLELSCEPPLFVSLADGWEVIETRALEPEVDELAFVLDPVQCARPLASLRLRLVDAITREPMGAVWVQVRTGWSCVNHRVDEARPEIVFRKVPPGPNVIEVRALGYEFVRREVVLERGTEHDLGTIALQPTSISVLTLRVDSPEDVEKASICGTTPHLFSGHAPSGSWDHEEIARGEELELQLGNGRWVVWAEAEVDDLEYSSSLREIELTGAAAREVLVLQRLAPLVFRPVAEPLSVRILDAGGLVPQMQDLFLGGQPLRIELVPGSYELLVRDRNGAVERRHIELGPSGASVEID